MDLNALYRQTPRSTRAIVSQEALPGSSAMMLRTVW